MTLALIAGTGRLPPILVSALLDEGRAPVLCEMRGFPSQVDAELTRIPFRIETLGTLLQTMTSLGVTEVCFAGAVQRPAVDPSAIDAATAPLVPRLQAAMAKGDDGTLREIIAIFEEHGFSVTGAHQILPALLPAAGVPTAVTPPDLTADIAVAVTALAEMGRADMGQAVIVKSGRVLAREDARGTDALLRDFCPPDPPSDAGGDVFSTVLDGVSNMLGEAADWLSGQDQTTGEAAGGFLYKAPKPGQVLQADMPTIGPQTALRAGQAGLAGLVIAEGGVMVIDLPEVIKTLDRQGQYLWVCP